MDTFVDSSWYWWRYLSPRQGGRARSIAPLVDRWCPVDQYTGGAEHAVMHLHVRRASSTKAMRDLGLVHEREPFKRLFNQGQILGADGERMSKSRGNVQDPDDLVARYGADTIRLFLMFMGPWDQGGPWSPTGIGGVAPLPEPRLDGGPGPARQRGGDPDGATCPRASDRSGRRGGAAHRRPPHAADVTDDYDASTSTRWSPS